MYFGDYQVGFRFGRLGLDLVEKRGLDRFSDRFEVDGANAVRHARKHLRESTERFIRPVCSGAMYRGSDCNQPSIECPRLRASTWCFSTSDTI
jgi:predicted RNA-binding Zn ribbon-like protein